MVLVAVMAISRGVNMWLVTVGLITIGYYNGLEWAKISINGGIHGNVITASWDEMCYAGFIPILTWFLPKFEDQFRVSKQEAMIWSVFIGFGTVMGWNAFLYLSFIGYYIPSSGIIITFSILWMRKHKRN